MQFGGVTFRQYIHRPGLPREVLRHRIFRQFRPRVHRYHVPVTVQQQKRGDSPDAVQLGQLGPHGGLLKGDGEPRHRFDVRAKRLRTPKTNGELRDLFINLNEGGARKTNSVPFRGG